jgi:hypothetical protein
MRWQFFKRRNTSLLRQEANSPLAKAQPAIRCPLCGKEFCAGEVAECATCSLAAHCGLVLCPNCSYEFAP